MTGESPVLDSLVDRLDVDAGGRNLVLLATTRRWLGTALDEVITPEGFELREAGDADELVNCASEHEPAIVIVDEELPGLELAATARALVEGPIDDTTPLLLYTASSVARGDIHTAAYRAGFWDLLDEPLRPSVFVARLRRLLAMSDRMKRRGASVDSPESAPSTVGFLTLDELGRVLPSIGALAEREGTSMSIVLISPTPSPDEDAPGTRSTAASLCCPNLRRADLCAWIDDAEVAIVAFDTDAEEARSLVERLDAEAENRRRPGDAREHLSAAVVELGPSGELGRVVRRAGQPGTGDSVSLDEVVELFHLGDARRALRDAREAGGGVRIVEVA